MAVDELREALRRAQQVAEGRVAPEPLRAALEVLEPPWRVAVIGRTGAGKSTLINAVLGERRQHTGLGGVTSEVGHLEVDEGLLLVDTPGMDEPAHALAVLQPLLELVDAVVWVVDGLQPMTASEREVVEHALVAGTPLAVVVSRVDLLDEGEEDQVLARVRALAAPHAPAAVLGVDLRRACETGWALPDAVAPRLPGPRRAHRIRAWVGQVRRELEQLPSTPELSVLRARWTSAVREATRQVEQQVEQGRIRHKSDALRALARHDADVRRAVVSDIALDVQPLLPTARAPEGSPLSEVLAGMSGAEGARRVLRAFAARWLAEGEVVLEEWWAEQEALVHEAAGRRALEEALSAVSSRLSG